MEELATIVTLFNSFALLWKRLSDFYFKRKRVGGRNKKLREREREREMGERQRERERERERERAEKMTP